MKKQKTAEEIDRELVALAGDEIHDTTFDPEMIDDSILSLGYDEWKRRQDKQNLNTKVAKV